MGIIIGILLEAAFLEILIIILLFAVGSSQRKKSENEFVIKVKEGVEPKRNLNEKKVHKEKNKRILKRKTGEFERFLILLIPLVIVAYFLLSNYLNFEVSIMTIALLALGIIVISIFIFFEAIRKYR